MAQAARYHGKDGEYLGGVPAKSLDEAEFANLTDEQKASVAASNIYTLTDSAQKEAATSERRIEREQKAESAPVADEPKAEGKK